MNIAVYSAFISQTSIAYIKNVVDYLNRNNHKYILIDSLEKYLGKENKKYSHFNDNQKLVIAQKVVNRFGEVLSGLTFGIWGLSFKPGTDDMREAPSIYVIKDLVNRGAKIKAYDPKSINEAKQYYLKGVENITYVDSKYDVVKDSDALILLTEWKEYSLMILK